MTAPTTPEADLHAEIMNLPCDTELCAIAGVSAMLAYKSGHRDARHAAAELALQADAREAASRAEIERLRDVLYQIKLARNLGSAWVIADAALSTDTLKG